MKSTNVLIAALASTAAAQPHAHGHAHQHLAREHQHQHEHAKRVLETEVVVEWVTETVTELIEGTATQWITPSAAIQPATTFATLTSSSAASSSSQDAGQFYEGPSSSTASSVVVEPMETVAAPSTSSTSVVPAPTTTSTSSAYVAPVEATTSSIISTPAVVEPTSTSTTAEAAATTASSSGVSTGWKITWIGPTTGAYTSCGAIYQADSMFVAVDPSVLPACSTDGTGTAMTITANGKTISAYAIDKCMGCDATHIDVATAVYEALGWDTSDGGMHDTGDITWTIS